MPTDPPSSSTPSPCSGCTRVDRRAFLGTASTLSVAAWLMGCGDGVFDGPAVVADILRTPIRVDPAQYPALQAVGGRAVITPVDRAPMLVETIGVKRYRAFSLECPHKGTIVTVGENGFTCPNHQAQFARDGAWIGGQATADLLPIAVAVEPTGVLMVGGVVIPPALALSVNAVSFSTAIGGATSSPQGVDITNIGGGTLSGIAMTLSYASNQPTGWLIASLSAVAAPASITLSVSRGSLAAGSYSATVLVSAPGTSNAAQQIRVTLVVTDPNSPAALQLSATAMSFSAAAGSSPTTQALQIVNSGGGSISALAFAISYGAGATGWLSTSSLGATTAPATLTMRPLSSALAAGTYTATVTISGAAVTARSLTVTLTVVAAGLAVTISAWPSLANVGGVAGSVGTINFSGVAVVRTGASSFAAFSLYCPHQGYLVSVLSGQSFRCARHGATWNANGSLMSNSPLRTGSLSSLQVTYVPGDDVLYVS